MNASIAAQPHKVYVAVRPNGVFKRVDQHIVRVERAILYASRDPNDLLLDNPSCTDVLMPDFAVAHDAVGEADIPPARVHRNMRVARHQPVVDRGARQVDRVGVIPLDVRVRAPSVPDDQHDRSSPRWRHSVILTGPQGFSHQAANVKETPLDPSSGRSAVAEPDV